MQFKKLPLPVSADELTRQQAEFVTLYIEAGGRKGCEVDAALKAGYANGVRKNAETQARSLLKNPRVVAAIKAEISHQFGAAAVRAVGVLMELAEVGPPQVRLQAAKDILDRAIGPVMSRSAHLHAKAETVEDILALLDAEEERQKNAIDAEYEEVEGRASSDQKDVQKRGAE